MKSLTVLVFSLTIAVVFSDSGYFIPKAFYTIDEFGNASPLVYLTPKQHRIRRSPGGGSFSSSSSSSSSYSGSPIYFGGPSSGSYSSSQSSSHSGPAYYGNDRGYDPGYGSQGAYDHGFGSSSRLGGEGIGPVGNGITLHSRFADDSSGSPGIQVSGSSTGNKGVYSSSSTSIDSNGKVHYSVQSGKF